MNDVIFNPVDPLPKVWDPNDRIGDMLVVKRGLVVGIANEHSIAFGCAAKLRSPPGRTDPSQFPHAA